EDVEDRWQRPREGRRDDRRRPAAPRDDPDRGGFGTERTRARAEEDRPRHVIERERLPEGAIVVGFRSGDDDACVRRKNALQVLEVLRARLTRAGTDIDDGDAVVVQS